MLAAGGISAQPCLGAAPSQPATNPATVKYQVLIRICGLTPEQQGQLLELDKSITQKVDAFLAAHAEELQKADAAIAEAIRQKDLSALAAARQAKQDILAPLLNAARQDHESIMAILTPEQKALWQEFTVMESVKARFMRAGLTGEQTARLKAAYAEYAAETGATPASITARLISLAESLLTDQQKQALAAARLQGGSQK